MLIPLLYSVLYGQERLGHQFHLPLAFLLWFKEDGVYKAGSTSGAIIHPRPGVIVYVRETRSDPRPSSGTNNDALDCGYHRYIALHSRHLKNSPLFSDTWKFWPQHIQISEVPHCAFFYLFVFTACFIDCISYIKRCISIKTLEKLYEMKRK